MRKLLTAAAALIACTHPDDQQRAIFVTNAPIGIRVCARCGAIATVEIDAVPNDARAQWTRPRALDELAKEVERHAEIEKAFGEKIDLYGEGPGVSRVMLNPTEHAALIDAGVVSAFRGVPISDAWRAHVLATIAADPSANPLEEEDEFEKGIERARAGAKGYLAGDFAQIEQVAGVVDALEALGVMVAAMAPVPQLRAVPEIGVIVGRAQVEERRRWVEVLRTRAIAVIERYRNPQEQGALVLKQAALAIERFDLTPWKRGGQASPDIDLTAPCLAPSESRAPGLCTCGWPLENHKNEGRSR